MSIWRKKHVSQPDPVYVFLVRYDTDNTGFHRLRRGVHITLGLELYLIETIFGIESPGRGTMG